MRIQETDRILKESRNSRHQANGDHSHDGMLTKAWRNIAALPGKLTGMLHRSSH